MRVAAILIVTVAPTASAETGEDWLRMWPSRAQRLELHKHTSAENLTDEARIEVVRWLERDVAASQEHFTRTGVALGEAFGEYYIDLVLLVASLKDPRSIGALSMATDVAGVVSTTLAEFGDSAVDPVLAQLNNSFLRDSSIFTLGKFVQGKTLKKCDLSETNVVRIRATLLQVAHDSAPSVRQTAVEALAYLAPDVEILSVIRDIADHDPYVREPTEGSMPDHFPVRDAARRALKRMQSGR
jgi:HEAT repeat protein